MRKITVALTAIAALAVAAIAPAFASADVQRYQLQTATFTVTQPAGQVGQWDNVWTHSYTVEFNNPCTSSDSTVFTGTGHVSGRDQNGPFESDETITGSYANGRISFTATRPDGFSYSLSDAQTDGSSVTTGTSNPVAPWTLEFKVTNPEITSTHYKNHGDYVSSVGGGADAAHSCIGMPINSSK